MYFVNDFRWENDSRVYASFVIVERLLFKVLQKALNGMIAKRQMIKSSSLFKYDSKNLIRIRRNYHWVLQFMTYLLNGRLQ